MTKCKLYNNNNNNIFIILYSWTFLCINSAVIIVFVRQKHRMRDFCVCMLDEFILRVSFEFDN